MFSLNEYFDDILQAREALKNYSFLNNVPFKIKKTDSTRILACCPNNEENIECGFIISIRKQHNDLLKVIKLVPHSCFCLESNHARKFSLINDITPLTSQIKSIRPVDLQTRARLEYETAVPYSTAWYALNNIKKEGKFWIEKSFSMISSFMEEMQKKNPNFCGCFEVGHENVFERAFICLSDDINLFENSRKILILDGCHIRNSLGGVILAASLSDGLDRILPICLCLCSIENQINWQWFLQKSK